MNFDLNLLGIYPSPFAHIGRFDYALHRNHVATGLLKFTIVRCLYCTRVCESLSIERSIEGSHCVFTRCHSLRVRTRPFMSFADGKIAKHYRLRMVPSLKSWQTLMRKI